MSKAARGLQYSYAEYLALEEESSVRHEYLDGEIYAMAGGTPDHAALAAAVIALLGRQLPPGCRVFTSDLRIRIPAVTNPVLLVEVTSRSTEDYDRGEKLRHCKALGSIREILIVSHRQPRLDLHRGGGGAWTTQTASRGEALSLESIASRIAVDEVYKGGLEDSA